jgi:hypothetical protein
MFGVAPAGQLKATLHHTKIVEAVTFSPDASRVFARDVAGKAWAWTVADGRPTDPDNPPAASKDRSATSPDWTLRAEARGSTVVLLDLAHFDLGTERFERLALEPGNRVWWYQQRAARAERDQNWFAAAFHLGLLLKNKPDDADLLRRRESALDKLANVGGSNAPRYMDKLPP